MHTIKSLFAGRRSREVYALCGCELIRGLGSDPQDRLPIAQITAWQIHPEMVFDMIEITLSDGRRVVWLDASDDLSGILRRITPSCEQVVVERKAP